MEATCDMIQNRCRAHFQMSVSERDREAHEDVFFTTELLAHVVKKTNGHYGNGCIDCWRAYHNFRACAQD